MVVPMTVDASPVPSVIWRLLRILMVVTYNGSPTPPTSAGSYPVVGTVSNANYQGSASGTLVVSKAAATVTPGNLNATYDGTAKEASVTTDPARLGVFCTYNGSPAPPIAIGSYTVEARVTDSNYQGIATGILVISGMTFSEWQAAQFSSSDSAVIGPQANPAHDGLPNLLRVGHCSGIRDGG